MSRSRFYGFILVTISVAASTQSFAGGADHSDLSCKTVRSEPGKIECRRDLKYQAAMNDITDVSTDGVMSCVFADGELRCTEMDQPSASPLHDVAAPDEISCIALAGRVNCGG